MQSVTAALVVYAIGVVLGVVLSDARPLARLPLALLWPLGPLAFVLTMAVLLVVGIIAFPLIGVVIGVAVAAAIWGLR